MYVNYVSGYHQIFLCHLSFKNVGPCSLKLALVMLDKLLDLVCNYVFLHCVGMQSGIHGVFLTTMNARSSRMMPQFLSMSLCTDLVLFQRSSTRRWRLLLQAPKRKYLLAPPMSHSKRSIMQPACALGKFGFQS